LLLDAFAVIAAGTASSPFSAARTTVAVSVLFRPGMMNFGGIRCFSNLDLNNLDGHGSGKEQKRYYGFIKQTRISEDATNLDWKEPRRGKSSVGACSCS